MVRAFSRQLSRRQQFILQRRAERQAEQESTQPQQETQAYSESGKQIIYYRQKGTKPAYGYEVVDSTGRVIANYDTITMNRLVAYSRGADVNVPNGRRDVVYKQIEPRPEVKADISAREERQYEKEMAKKEAKTYAKKVEEGKIDVKDVTFTQEGAAKEFQKIMEEKGKVEQTKEIKTPLRQKEILVRKVGEETYATRKSLEPPPKGKEYTFEMETPQEEYQTKTRQELFSEKAKQQFGIEEEGGLLTIREGERKSVYDVGGRVSIKKAEIPVSAKYAKGFEEKLGTGKMVKSWITEVEGKKQLRKIEFEDLQRWEKKFYEPIVETIKKNVKFKKPKESFYETEERLRKEIFTAEAGGKKVEIAVLSAALFGTKSVRSTTEFILQGLESPTETTKMVYESLGKVKVAGEKFIKTGEPPEAVSSIGTTLRTRSEYAIGGAIGYIGIEIVQAYIGGKALSFTVKKAKVGLTRISPKYKKVVKTAFDEDIIRNISRAKGEGTFEVGLIPSGRGKQVLDIDVARFIREEANIPLAKRPAIPRLNVLQRQIVEAGTEAGGKFTGSFAQKTLLTRSRKFADIDIVVKNVDEAVDIFRKRLGGQVDIKPMVITDSPLGKFTIARVYKKGKVIADIDPLRFAEEGYISKFETVKIGKTIFVSPEARLSAKLSQLARGKKTSKVIMDITQLSGVDISKRLESPLIKGAYGFGETYQKSLVGQKGLVTTSARDLFKPLRSQVDIKPLTPLYATPPEAGTGRALARVTRLGVGREEASLMDILSGRFEVSPTRPQIVVFEDITIGKEFTLTPPPFSELEVWKRTGTIKKVKTVGRTIIKGEAVPIISAEIVDKEITKGLGLKSVKTKGIGKYKSAADISRKTFEKPVLVPRRTIGEVMPIIFRKLPKTTKQVIRPPVRTTTKRVVTPVIRPPVRTTPIRVTTPMIRPPIRTPPRRVTTPRITTPVIRPPIRTPPRRVTTPRITTPVIRPPIRTPPRRVITPILRPPVRRPPRKVPPPFVPTPPPLRPPFKFDLPELKEGKKKKALPREIFMPPPTYTPTLVGLEFYPKIKATKKLSKQFYSPLIPRPQAIWPKKRKRRIKNV